jgi:integrase
LTRWLKASVEPVAKAKTHAGYESIVRIRVVPHIGRIDLTRCSALDVQALYAVLTTSGLSARSVRHTHNTLHKAFAQAMRWGLIARNPCDGATPPRPVRTEMHVLTGAQSSALLTATRAHPMHALYVLALTTGMRQGELLGLRWSDLNMDAGRLMVQRALQRQRSGLVFTSPKTSRSRRTIMLGDAALTALRQHRTRQNEARLASPHWHDDDLVFANDTGGPLDPSWQTHVFKTALSDAGLPAIRFHDLRHTAATLLLAAGVSPKVIADMLGHTTITITLDTYSAYVPAMHMQAAATMDAILSA